MEVGAIVEFVHADQRESESVEDEDGPCSDSEEIVIDGQGRVGEDDDRVMNVATHVMADVPDDIKPKEGMIFETLAEVMEFYHNYGRFCGFQIRIKSVENHARTLPLERDDPRNAWDENANRARLHCSKGGTFSSKSKNPQRTPRTMKTNCGARLNAWKTEEGLWRISKFVEGHNHLLYPDHSRFMSTYRHISLRDKGRLVTNNRAGISMNKNFMAAVVEKGGFSNVPFTEKDCRNLIDKQRRLCLAAGDYAAMDKYFEEQERMCKDFLHVKETNEEGMLRNVFWVDGRSRSAYRDFGDVVSFDATYLKNRYRMPFTPFIGVNHHGQSILFGCALISSEDTNNYVWLFRQWKQAMHGKAPKGIVTDQCPAIGKSFFYLFSWTLFHKIIETKQNTQNCEHRV